jgi:PAS domain S-box-containing protein
LLPSGRFPRIATAIAVTIALLLVLDLELVKAAATKLFVSNSLDFIIVLFAAGCSFYAARRSAGYARQVWLLVGIAFGLETIGQGISTYYQSFVPGAAQSPWPSDVLFFVWAAPIFMIFLPVSDEQAVAIDSVRVLDFLQVAILAVTLYLYFFYAPSRWQSDQPSLLREILMVYTGRDLLLSSAFFVRWRAAIPVWVRSFSAVLAVVFLLMVLADAEYLIAIVDLRVSAGWGDLIWMMPSIIVIVYAVTWIQPESTASLATSSRAGRLLNAQILPIAIPLCVIFMGRAIAREQVVLAWLIVTASVLCSSVRLLLTNRGQQRISDNLLSTERALRRSEEILSSAFRNSPDAFSINPFPNGPYFEVNDGFTRLTGYSREETLGRTPREMDLWEDAEVRQQALTTLTSTGQLRDFEFRFRTKSGHIRVGQMSASVVDLGGQRCVLVIVRDVTDRKEAEEILRSSEERFRWLVRDLHFAVVLHRPDGTVEFANPAAHRLLNLPENGAVGLRLTDLGVYAVSEDGKPLPYEEHPIPQVLRTHEPIRDGLMAFRRSGSENIFWLYGSSIPQFDSNGNLIRVISSFADVSEMKNAERAIHNLSTQLLKLQDEERRRFGRELHDGLAQTVLAINLSLAQVRQSLVAQDRGAALPLEKARELTQQMSREIRTLSYLLHPPLLDDLGLLSTLKEYVHGFSERSGIDTQLRAWTDFDRLPQPLEIALFRIVQESLANVQRHSGSKAAEIRLEQRDSLLTLEVIDHGHGLTLSANGNPTQRQARLGVGIPGMRERMAQLGGHLEIISNPTGTTVRATISVPPTSSTEALDASAANPDRG